MFNFMCGMIIGGLATFVIVGYILIHFYEKKLGQSNGRF